MITGTGTTSLRKQDLVDGRIQSVGYTKTKFAHKAIAGATGINLAALTTPPEMSANGFVNPSASQIAAANILFYRNNLKLVSSLRGDLLDYVSYVVAGSTQINFVGFTAQEGEIFVGTIDYTAVSGLQVVSATGQPATGVLAAGTNTFNIGYPIPTNQYSTTQLGGVLVYLDGVLQTRNTGNSSTTLDGNYYELDNGSGNFSQIVFNVIDPINARNVLVVPNGLLVPQPDGSLLTTVQAQAGQINQLAQYVASLTGQSTTTVLGGAASYTDLLAFGNLVNTINNSYASTSKSNSWSVNQLIPGNTSGTTPGASYPGETVSISITPTTGSTTLGVNVTCATLTIPSAGVWDIYADYLRGVNLSALSGGFGCIVDTTLYQGSTIIRQIRDLIPSGGPLNLLVERVLVSPAYITTGPTTFTLQFQVSKWAGTETITVTSQSCGPSNSAGNGFFAIRRY